MKSLSLDMAQDGPIPKCLTKDGNGDCNAIRGMWNALGQVQDSRQLHGEFLCAKCGTKVQVSGWPPERLTIQ